MRAGALRTRTTTGYSRPNRGEDLIVPKTTESTFGQRSEVETDKRRFFVCYPFAVTEVFDSSWQLPRSTRTEG